MNRDNWRFAYTADKVLLAALEKKVHSENRLKWWADKREEIIAKVKAEGIEIDESLADLSLSNSYGRQPSARIRNDLVADLSECVQKTMEHRKKIEDYDAWVQVLESQGQSTLQLDQDDWLFFFGKN